jgi:hypothetical protein
MTITEKIKACEAFIKALAEELKDDYELVAAFEKDKRGSDKYLVPKGSAEEITYYGKPMNSFRCSTHWNWRAPLIKCNKENYIQCLNTDLPFAKKRNAEGESSDPIMAEQVAVIGEDGKYHAIYGEVFDRKKREWKWLEADPKEIVATYRRRWT